MPRIIPIRDLKNTTQISQMCKESKEPIFVTKPDTAPWSL